MALSADAFATQKRGRQIAPGVAASTKLYAGGLVAYNPGGYLAVGADTANFLFAGVAVEQVDNSSGADGDLDCNIWRGGVFLMTLATVIAQSNVGDMVCLVDDEKVDLAGDTDNDVVVGMIVEYVDTTHAWVDMSVGDSLAGGVSTEHGAGIIGTGVAPQTTRFKKDGKIITDIKIDLTGLAVVGTAAKDAIGLSAGGVAFIGRNVVAKNGIIYKIEMLCIEAPVEGTATITQDIDLGSDASGAIEYDGAVGTIVVNAATLVAGEVATNDVPALTANDYLYLIEGDTAATTGVYSAGQYIIRLHGYDMLA